ncbi:MAG: hypothetical protein HY686_02755 [Chloroflexi bacterium]|nr:hypothetical protein [Chloroflexota bacterium]
MQEGYRTYSFYEGDLETVWGQIQAVAVRVKPDPGLEFALRVGERDTARLSFQLCLVRLSPQGVSEQPVADMLLLLESDGRLRFAGKALRDVVAGSPPQPQLDTYIRKFLSALNVQLQQMGFNPTRG